ncbi:hypothetical protein TGRUB_214400 [Toxoplasma gondii RUB]|uniref:Uncharacterized protein n=6 Tax=Toxoplasma gondii TaxID=5811 RepID=A0A125YZS0_TOXGV|nr:hypothetical protein TGGT1_214400 [Toxoplasma gondii GT1]ESS31138.1 hypothetical protein TGVEG_214400 [Toxoplasma gondii VEG]KAF4640085.1 hypothetical protein TGRH88_040100 [Toxoplasma gondii]KFG62277.1 hypothetical protein TGRUB_214400 [Toxoplasma gondii RUB]KFH07797.1 hypothetical protein TGVAND_214400 [Toxoplasma gondii VAND]KFH16386.1 hypothetical protein TGMAS_214400 [Toxoplasma gondii MAS]
MGLLSGDVETDSYRRSPPMIVLLWKSAERATLIFCDSKSQREPPVNSPLSRSSRTSSIYGNVVINMKRLKVPFAVMDKRGFTWGFDGSFTRTVQVRIAHLRFGTVVALETGETFGKFLFEEGTTNKWINTNTGPRVEFSQQAKDQYAWSPCPPASQSFRGHQQLETVSLESFNRDIPSSAGSSRPSKVCVTHEVSFDVHHFPRFRHLSLSTRNISGVPCTTP